MQKRKSNKLISSSIIISIFISSCKDSENKKEFTLNDNCLLKEGAQSNIYNLFKNDKKIGRIDLNSDTLTFSSFYESGEVKGVLSTPLFDFGDSGSRAIVKLKDESNEIETHQILEKKFTEIDDSNSIIRGNGVYQWQLKK